MKNIFVYIFIISIFSFNSFAQKAKISRIEKKEGTNPIDPDTLIDTKSTSTITIKSYRVEESINVKFGGSTMTYEVTDLNMINKSDLGPNNTRVITPRYKEVEQPTIKKKLEPININMIIPKINEVKFSKEYQLKTPIKDLLEQQYNKAVIDSSVSTKKFVYVNLIKTYERIAEKGYKSVEIFQKLGDTYFFDEQYQKAAKWYGELFKMNSNLESVYYDRYIHALTVIGDKAKTSEMKKKRFQLFGLN